MNATYTKFGKTLLDYTTLFTFYRLLENDTSAYQLFSNLTNISINNSNISTKKQRVDSSFMLGWLYILSRYGLFKETIRVFFLALRKHIPGMYKNMKSELSQDYLQDDFDLTEKDKEKTRGRIKEIARYLYLLKSSFDNNHQISHYKMFITLCPGV